MVAQDGQKGAIERRLPRGSGEGELWHKEQGEHIASTDALSGAAYAAFGIGILLLLLATWSYLR